MGLQGNLEDTPPNTVLDFRSDSPAIITKEQIISDKDANVSLQTVKCSKCDRSFTIERIQKHEEICNKVKERKVYDIVEMRVKGTDTEALVKAGKVKLEPAKPIERKSVLNQRLGQLPSEPLPPIQPKANTNKIEDKSANSKNATAFQVVFDENSDGIKTKKYSKFSSILRPNKKLPSQKIDDRYLSAERARDRWISAAQKISPGIENLEDEEVDYLAASMTSKKTVCSDAFDFLFDSQNLNPDKIQEEIKAEQAENARNMKKSTKSFCCIIC